MPIMLGHVYAYRKCAKSLGEPVIPTEVVRRGLPRSRKVRVKYLDGEYEGLEEWVPDVRLITEWQDAESLIRDEKALLYACELSGEAGQGPYRESVDCVLSALAEALEAELIHTGWSSADGDLLVIEGFPDPASAVGLAPEALLLEPGGFVDRLGPYKAPFSVALSVAQHVCRRYSDAVASYLRREQRKLARQLLEAQGNGSRDFWEKEMQKLGAACVIVGEWCGANLLQEFDENAMLRAEVERLRQMIRHLADWLRDAGHPVKAGLVLKQLKERDD